jgi:hypothetical protein
MDSQQIEAQIYQLEKKFKEIPEKIFELGKVKHNPKFFAMIGKIASLKKKLLITKHIEYLSK